MQLFYRRAPTVSRMSKKLYKISIMWRVCGCFHVANINSRDLSQARVPWKSFYSFYTLLCASMLICFTIMQIRAAARETTQVQGTMSNSLLILMRNVTGLEAVVVFLVMTTRSGALLRFLRNAQTFEASMTASPSYPATQKWIVPYVSNVLCFACVVSYSSYRIMVVLIKPYHQITTADVLLVLYTLVGNAIYLSCDYGSKATARAVCDVLIDYLKMQNDMLVQKQQSGLTVGDVDVVRNNMTTIQALKDEFNTVMNPCIGFFCLKAFTVVSVSGYMLLCLGFRHEASALILLYGLQVAFGLLDLAFISHTLENEVENIKLSLADSITADTSSAYISQVRFVYNALEPRQMCLSAGGFFAINTRTLMRVAEAVVTYSVILIQTGDAVIHASDHASSL